MEDHLESQEGLVLEKNGRSTTYKTCGFWRILSNFPQKSQINEKYVPRNLPNLWSIIKKKNGDKIVWIKKTAVL